MNILRIIFMIALIITTLNAWGDELQPESVENQFLIKLTPYGRQLDVPAIQQDLGLLTIKKFDNIGVELWEIKSDNTRSINRSRILRQLRSDPRVEYIEPNFIIKINQLALWNLNQINAPDAWNFNYKNSVIVAVIDTGIDYTHPDLAANMWKNTSEIANNGIDDDANGCVDDIYGCDFANGDGDPFDDNSHGTHVAGIITAVSSTAKLMAVKFLKANGTGTLADAISAIQYAAKMGAQISNNSWGCMGCKSQALADAIQTANNSLFIAAAGNDFGNDNDSNPIYPASYDFNHIISVAANDKQDNLAAFSNYGLTTVDISAPGVDIYSTIPSNSYKSLSGSSMATPHVSAAISLLWSKCPQLNITEVKQIILESVDKIANLETKTVSGGRLNLYKAINSCVSPLIAQTSCEHAVYIDKEKRLKLPFLEIPLLDNITEEYTNETAIVKAELQMLEGVEDFTVIPETVKFIKMLDQENECHAKYSYETRSMYIPFIDMPSTIKLSSGITIPGPIQVFETTLKQLPLSSQIFHLKEYNFLYTIE
jgi:hypothetical protein